MTAYDKIIKARASLVLDAPFWGSLVLRLRVEETEEIETCATDGRVLKYSPKFVNTLTSAEIIGLLIHEVMHCALGHMIRLQGRAHTKWNIACDFAINPIIKKAGFEIPSEGLLKEEWADLSADEIYNMLPDSYDYKPFGEIVSPGMTGDGCSESEKKQIVQEWKVAMIQAAQVSRNTGKIPGGMERLIDGLLNPRVNWVDVLRQFVNSYARNDYLMYPPNRRYLGQGLYLPSMRSENLGTIIVVMDTSGSIDSDALCKFSTELTDISNHYQTDIQVIYCDSKVQKVEHFDWNSEIELHPKGGGGTDFCPPFEWVENSQEDPACLVYFTDGWCDSYPDKPNYPVLWGIHDSNCWKKFNPPFGEVVAVI